MDKKDLLGISGIGKQKIDLKNIVLAGAGNLGLESSKEDKPGIMLFVDDHTDTRLVRTLIDKMDSDIIIASPYDPRNETSDQNYLGKSLIAKLGPRPYTENISKLFDEINSEIANIQYQESEIESILGVTSGKMIGVLSARPYSELSIPDMEMNKCYSEISGEDMSMYSDLDNTRDYMKKFSPRKTLDKRNMIKKR